jgi:1-aminocyclopropane-1-carboxylate deaminase/D-cysteine desulfhydrase-like pyridoxal-dependent ACC family enzyme
MQAIVSYPTRNGTPVPESIAAAERLGATLLPLRGNHVGICNAQARTRIEAMGGWMLPFGLECSEAVVGVAQEAARVPATLASGTIVLCCGSGVTLAGLLTGLPVAPARIIGLSSGRSLAKIRACVQRFVHPLPSTVELLDASMPYDAVPAVASPFPAHPNYDLKAWNYLCENIGGLRGPILFWNIGA